MAINRQFLIVVTGAFLLFMTACGGGGGGTPVQPPTVDGIQVNPATVSAGSVVSLSGIITGGTGAGALIKNWTVSNGTLAAEQPDFALLLRETAKRPSLTSLSTEANTVYWIVPTEPMTATVTLQVEGSSSTREVLITVSQVTMSVTTGDSGAKVCTVQANDITDLYQIAFRVNYTSDWTPVSMEPGTFLGIDDDPFDETNEILHLAMLNQPGFVPVAITRKGDVPGVSGTGVLATVTFNRAGTSNTTSATYLDPVEPFAIDALVMRDSHDNPIPLQ